MFCIRRHFYAVLLLLLICFPVPVIGEETIIRIVAANLTSGNFQSYEEPGKRILQGLNPDICLIQEFNVGANADSEIAAFVEEVFGTDFQWYREPGDEQIPNGIISRYPIVDAGEWEDTAVENRDFAWARIDIPGSIDLWAVSVHFLTSNTTDRNTEATTLKNYIESNIPAENYLIIGGDLNTGSRSETAITTLSDIAVTSLPFPADQNGNDNTNRDRDKPYDWLLPNSVLNEISTTLVIGSSAYPDGLVFDSRVYTPLSEVSPVLETDSAADGMQHMAVVRDFLITDNDFTTDSDTIDFGTVDACAAPFIDNSITLKVFNTFDITGVTFEGIHAEEFSLINPDLTSGSVTISSDINLSFAWTPVANDEVMRNVTSTISTRGTPSSVTVFLKGIPKSSSSEPLDIGGYQIEQISSTVLLTFPQGLIIQPGEFIVIGRNATKTEFEQFWGTLPAGVIYINGKDIVGGNGFPVINGDEQYRIMGAGSEQVDPVSGYLPSTPIGKSRTYQRDATNVETFTAQLDPSTTANPGLFSGTKAGTGKLVITEISDAVGTGNYVYEFIEILYDAAGGSPQSAYNGWIFH